MISFDEESEYLPIKTVVEYFYCQRAAFYMLTNWENNLENPYLFKGSQQHRAIEHIPYKHRPSAKVIYRYKVVSHRLRIYGVCDAVEFSQAGSAYPIEYKTGKTRINVMHRAQLYLQAVCLEEMLARKIDQGYIYFVESRVRHLVSFRESEKALILDKVAEMRNKFKVRNIRAFSPCGHPLCSYHTIDDPILYYQQ